MMPMPIIIAPALAATAEQIAELQRIARSTSTAHRQVIQAKGLLWAIEGVANEEIARRCEVDSDSVRQWRRRFEQEGVDGVGKIAKGRGRKSWMPEGTVSKVLYLTLAEEPEDTSTHWSTRTLGKQVGVSKDSVAKIWRDYKLKPWQQDRFKLSNDPRFEEKVVDVVGLYVDPLKRRLCSASTRKPSARPSTALNLHFPCVREGSEPSPTTTSATGPPICLPRST